MSETLPSPGWALNYPPSPAEWDNWWKSKVGSVPTTIVATGTVQGDAALIQSHLVVVVSPSVANAGIIQQYGFHEIWNRCGYTILFWPASGVNFEGQDANTSIRVTNNSRIKMIMTSATQAWIG